MNGVLPPNDLAQFFGDLEDDEDWGWMVTAANLDPAANRGWYIESGYLMAPGEVNWLLDYHSKDAAVNSRLAAFVENVSIRANYCSVTHECATACFPDGSCKPPPAAVFKKESDSTTQPDYRHRVMAPPHRKLFCHSPFGGGIC
jgi:hypothetical protein